MYVGQFQDNRFHGSGVMTYDFGDRFEGDWQRGVLVASAKGDSNPLLGVAWAPGGALVRSLELE